MRQQANSSNNLISIPFGAIKRRFCRCNGYAPHQISIPFGAIKSKRNNFAQRRLL